MTRREFIEGLRRALSGKVDAGVIDESVRYYEDYIDIQIKQGMSEEEVLQSLGNPAFIAKSIVSANGSGQGYAGASDSVYEEGKSERYSRSKFGDKGVHFIMNMPGWLTALLAGVIILVIIGLIFSVLSFLAPVLVPLLIVSLVIRLYSRRR